MKSLYSFTMKLKSLNLLYYKWVFKYILYLSFFLFFFYSSTSYVILILMLRMISPCTIEQKLIIKSFNYFVRVTHTNVYRNLRKLNHVT